MYGPLATFFRPYGAWYFLSLYNPTAYAVGYDLAPASRAFPKAAILAPTSMAGMMPALLSTIHYSLPTALPHAAF